LQVLLDNDYRVLLYNGQLDIIIANSLTQAFIDSLQWKGKDDFTKVSITHLVQYFLYIQQKAESAFFLG
jgi:vitellogenic carboxypeptidase-like protein